MNLHKDGRGFGHVELIMACLVVAFFGIVGYRVVTSHAQVPPDHGGVFYAASCTMGSAAGTVRRGAAIRPSITVRNTGSGSFAPHIISLLLSVTPLRHTSPTL